MPPSAPTVETVEAPSPAPRPTRSRDRGAGWEPLGGAFRRILDRITVDGPPEDEQLAADDGGPFCGACNSLRFVRRDVAREHPDFGKAFPCTAAACLAWSRGRRLERFWRDVPTDIRAAALELGPAHPGQRPAFEMVETWRTWPGFWIYLHGPTGRGKSWLAAAAARALGLAADFVKVDYLLRRIAGTYDKEARDRDKVRELDVLERLWGVPLLVLDEFGVEAPTAWAEERLYQVVDGRATEPDRVTIITSNLSPAALESRLARVDPQNGERVVSRILGRCGPFVVDVGGPDLRLRSYVKSTLREA